MLPPPTPALRQMEDKTVAVSSWLPGVARRETETLETFLCSELCSCVLARYPSPQHIKFSSSDLL